MKIPEIVYYEDNAQNGWDWIMYQYVEGASLFEIKRQLNTNDICGFFFEIGRELGKFHNMKTWYQPNKEEKSIFIQKIIQKTELNYNCLEERRNSVIFQKVIQFLREHYPILEAEANYSPVIKDFNDKHIIINQEMGKWVLTGIIDFEQVVFQTGSSILRFSILIICCRITSWNVVF